MPQCINNLSAKSKYFASCMNIILFEKSEVQHDSAILRGVRAKHIVKVLRSDVDDSVRVGIIDGAVGSGLITKIKRKYPFEVELSLRFFKNPPKRSNIDLLLALPRPIMLKRILSQITTLGVGTINIVNARRVEKSFWESSLLQKEHYRPYLLQGLEQAVDTQLPEIKVFRSFHDFYKGQLPSLATKYDTMLLAHPTGKRNLSQLMDTYPGRILFAVGPEGGWVDFELEKLKLAGMQLFSLGERILKVDTAVVSIYSRIVQRLEY